MKTRPPQLNSNLIFILHKQAIAYNVITCMLKITRKSGDRHGRLVLAKEVEPNRWGGRRYLFKCDCGETTVTSWGTSCSCGCLVRDIKRTKRTAGDRHGRLVLVKEVEPDRFGARQFLFKCDCGNTVIVRWGITRSCGCAQKEMVRNRLNYSKRLGSGEACLNFVYSRYRMAAKNRQRQFSLSKEDFKHLASQPCHYCGAAPGCIETKYGDAYGTFTYNGLDRVDSKNGYTLENTVPCCRTCNIAKHTMTREQFLQWIKNVYAHSCLRRPSS